MHSRLESTSLALVRSAAHLSPSNQGRLVAGHSVGNTLVLKNSRLVSGPEVGSILVLVNNGRLVSGLENIGRLFSGHENNGRLFSGHENNGRLVSGRENNGRLFSGHENSGRLVSGHGIGNTLVFAKHGKMVLGLDIDSSRLTWFVAGLHAVLGAPVGQFG